MSFRVVGCGAKLSWGWCWLANWKPNGSFLITCWLWSRISTRCSSEIFFSLETSPQTKQRIIPEYDLKRNLGLAISICFEWSKGSRLVRSSRHLRSWSVIVVKWVKFWQRLAGIVHLLFSFTPSLHERKIQNIGQRHNMELDRSRNL
jgi:hypothetical protein